MFKRIMTILGIVFGGFVVLTGAIFGIYALTGAFEEKTVHVSNVYIVLEDGTRVKDLTVYTLTDQTFKIEVLPENATDKTLTLIDYFDNAEVGVLEEIPTKIVSGKPFTLKINKDAKGNNVAGGVDLKIGVPGIDMVDIHLQVDVAIPNNVLYFAGKTNDSYSATGKAFTIAKSTKQSYVYLKSDLVNAFNVSVENGNNLKSAMIDYTYFNLDGEIVEVKTANDLNGAPVFDELERAYYYAVPIIPRESGLIKINAKMHRTYEIEKAFNKEYSQGTFSKLASMISSLGANDNNVLDMMEHFNQFLNDYIEYFDCSDESRKFFTTHILPDGKVEIPAVASYVEDAMKYIFVSCSAEVNVTAVNLKSINSKNEITKMNVFDTINYAKSSNVSVGGGKAVNLLDKTNENSFSLTLDLENGDQIGNTDNAAENLFDTLEIEPYLYLANVNGDDVKESWIPVYGFLRNESNIETNQPVTPNVYESLDDETKMEYVLDPIGYLINIQSHPDYKFITVAKRSSVDNKTYWEISYNVPMDIPSNEILINKALYLRFKIEGMDIKNNIAIIRESYSRIVINYKDYESVGLKYLQLSSLTTDKGTLVNSELKKKMALNSNLAPDSLGSDYQNNQQIINVDLSDSKNLGKENYKNFEYTNVMYFVEKDSNLISGTDKKIFSVGEYSFADLKGEAYTIGSGNNNKPLIGERIPVTNIAGIQTGSQYPTIYGLNASSTPIKVFAVVYLSNKEGQPIDLNGKVITINENSPENNVYNLYVVAISKYNDNEVDTIMIDSFVEKLYYYTNVTATNREFTFGNYVMSVPDSFLRNSVTEFSYMNGDSLEKLVDISETEKPLTDYINFLKLKLLAGIPLELEVLNYNKDDVDANKSKEVALDVIMVNGGKQLFAAKQNVQNNLQIAFNNMCKNFDTDYQVVTDDSDVEVEVEDLKADASGNYSSIIINIKIKDSAKDEDIDVEKTGSVYIAPSDISGVYNGKLPYSPLVDDESVSFVKNRLNIEGIGNIYETTESDSYVFVNRYQELTGKYKKDVSSSDDLYKLQFEIEDAEGESSVYEVPNHKNIVVNHADGDIITNLIKEDGSLDYSLVDISCPEEEGKGISSLIAEKTTNNNIKASFLTVTSYAKLNKEAKFTNEVDEVTENSAEYIYVGSSKHFINDGKVTIADNTYTVEDDKNDPNIRFITIPAGSYFPIIKNKDNKDCVLMLDEEFEIEVIDGNEKIVLSSFVSAPNEIGVEKVSTVDGNEAISSFIRKTTEGTDGNTTSKYEFIKGSENGTIVFLILKIGFEPVKVEGDSQSNENTKCKFEFYKVFTYKLFQNPIVLKGYNTDGDLNTENNRKVINGNSTETIYLGNTNTDGHILNNQIDQNIFKHITVTNTNKNFCFINRNDEEVNELDYKDFNESLQIKIKTNHLRNVDDNAKFDITYKYQGQTQSFTYYLTIEPSYTFTYVDSGKNVEDKTSYKISLDDNNEYNIADLLDSYFNWENVDSVKLIGKNISADGEMLKFADSYILKDEEIECEEFVYSIEFKVGSTTITIENILIISINPSVIIEAPVTEGLTNTLDKGVLIGTNIFDYINLYEVSKGGDGVIVLGNKIIDKDGYKNKFTFDFDNDDYEITTEGKIAGPVVENDVELMLTLKFPSAQLAKFENEVGILNTIQFKVKILGIKVTAKSGKNIEFSDGKIIVYVEKDVTQIDLTNYIEIIANPSSKLEVQAEIPGGYSTSISLDDGPCKLYCIKVGASLLRINTGYTIEFCVVKGYYDETGSIEDKSADLESLNFAYKASSYVLTLEVNVNTEININDYIVIFAGEDDPIYVSLKEKGSSEYVTAIVVNADNFDKTYDIYYFVNGEDGKYSTGYSIQIKVVNG